MKHDKNRKELFIKLHKIFDKIIYELSGLNL